MPDVAYRHNTATESLKRVGELGSKRTAVSTVATAICVVLLGLGVAVGLFARFYELGSRQLAVDEYYFVTSINLILENGLPKFPDGGYYARGILPQYLTAGVVLILGKTAFAYRLPAVLFSLLSVILAYRYSRHFIDRRYAAVLAVLLLTSSWQVEFARFARMYAIFQCLTIWFCLAVDAAYFRGRWKWRYMPHLLVVLAVGSQQLGLLLLPLLLIPFVLKQSPLWAGTRWHRYQFAAVSAITAALCWGFHRINWRSLGVSDLFPDLYTPVSTSLLRIPVFPFWPVPHDSWVSWAVVLASCGLTILVLFIWKRYQNNIQTSDIVLVLLVICTALHTFVLSFACALILVFRYALHRSLVWPRRVPILLGLAAVLGCGWVSYAMLTQAWMSYDEIAGSSLAGALYRTFWGWPDFYTSGLRLWSREFPWLSLLVVAAVAYHLVTTLRRPVPVLLRSPLVILLYFMSCFAVLKPLYPSTRYAFFLYPLVLLMLLQALSDAGRQWFARYVPLRAPARSVIPVCAVVGFFIMGADWDLKHLTQIVTPAASFRLGPFASFADTWYPRFDFASPAQYLNHQERDVTDRIVVLALPPVSFYLRRDHAVYYDRQDARFANVSRQRGTRDLWSNQRLCSTAEGMRHYTRDSQIVWLVRNVAESPQPFRIQDVWPHRLSYWERAYLSQDGRIEVIQIRLQSAA